MTTLRDNLLSVQNEWGIDLSPKRRVSQTPLASDRRASYLSSSQDRNRRTSSIPPLLEDPSHPVPNDTFDQRRLSKGFPSGSLVPPPIVPSSRRSSAIQTTKSVSLSIPNPDLSAAYDPVVKRRESLQRTDVAGSSNFRRLSMKMLIKPTEPPKNENLLTIEEILADRDEEANGFYLTTDSVKSIGCQADEDMQSFQVLQGILSGLKDELEVTKEMMNTNQRANLRAATASIYLVIGKQILGMERNLKQSFNTIRQDCGKALEGALQKIKKDHERYDQWLFAETLDRLEEQRAPVKAICEVAEKTLRKKIEEAENLRYVAARLGTVLKRHMILPEEDAKILEEDQIMSQQYIEHYENEIMKKDDDIRSLRMHISRLDKTIELLNQMKEEGEQQNTQRKLLDIIPRSIVVIEDEYITSKTSSDDLAHDKKDVIDPPVQTVKSQKQPDRSVSDSNTSLSLRFDPDDLLSSQIQEQYESKVTNLRDANAKEMAALLQKQKEITAKWKAKIDSANRLRREDGVMKVLRRQERILQLIVDSRKSRPYIDSYAQAELRGATLRDLRPDWIPLQKENQEQIAKILKNNPVEAMQRSQVRRFSSLTTRTGEKSGSEEMTAGDEQILILRRKDRKSFAGISSKDERDVLNKLSKKSLISETETMREEDEVDDLSSGPQEGNNVVDTPSSNVDSEPPDKPRNTTESDNSSRDAIALSKSSVSRPSHKLLSKSKPLISTRPSSGKRPGSGKPNLPPIK